MARKPPTERRRRMGQAVHAWEDMAHDYKFSSLSLEAFKAEMQQSDAAHARVADLRRQLRHALLTRDEVDARCMGIVYRVGYAVAGDPAFGCNSALLGAMGLTREIERRMRIRRGMRRTADHSKRAVPSLSDKPALCDDTGASHPASLG